jgi:hypothetical protein
MIFENRGVILGIMSFILSKINKIKKKGLVISDTKCRYIIGILFPDIPIHLFSLNHEYQFHLFEEATDGMIIHHLHQIPIIHAKKVMILPWYDINNPIIMYRYHSKKIYKKEKLLSNLEEFNKHQRFHFYPANRNPMFICGLRTWDSFMESQIIYTYLSWYPNNPKNILKFLSEQVGGFYCYQDYVYYSQFIPLIIPRIIYYPKNTNNIEKEKALLKLMELIGKKLEIINNIFF